VVAVALIGCFALPAVSVRPESVDASAKSTVKRLIPLKPSAPAARLSTREGASADGAATKDTGAVRRSSPRKVPEQRFAVGPFLPVESTKMPVAKPVAPASRGRAVPEKEVTAAFVVRAAVSRSGAVQAVRDLGN
jgi:hypothetical protein